MGKLAEAYVDISANLKPLEQGLGRAKSMLLSFGKAGAGIALGGGASLAGGLVAAAKKAADLGESLSKVRVTFGKDADGMIAQADDLAKRFGVIKQQALDAASAFGLMGRAAGLSTAASAKLGQEFVQLGLDLASYHNLSNEEAFGKLRSGLAGEAEPLRPLGIMLSEDAVKAEALAMGLTKVKRELNDQEKILARVSLIKKQSGSAVGDLVRTEDSNANQLRKLMGEIDNAAVEFGQHLQGALADAIKLAHEFGAAMQQATGKSAAENVGEMSRGGIGVARRFAAQGVRGGAGFIAGSALFALAHKVGLGGLVADQERQFQEAQASHMGLALEAGPAPGPDLAGRRNAMLANDAMVRQAADERARKKENDRIQRSAIGLAHKNAGATLAQTMGLGGTTLGALMGGQPAGEVARVAAAEADRRKEDADNAALNPAQRRQAALKPREFATNAPDVHFQTQQFSSGSDFARFALEKALSDPEKTQEQSLEELRSMAVTLKDLLSVGQGFIEKVDTAPPLRAILRGAT